MDQKQKTVHLLLVFLAFAFLYGCNATEPDTPVPASQDSATPPSSPTRTPAFTATPVATLISATPTLEPTEVSDEPSVTPLPQTPSPAPTWLSTPTATLTSVEFLAIRNPSIEALARFLVNLPDAFFHTTSFDSDYLIQEFRYRGLTANAELIYQDVNGDGQLEIVAASSWYTEPDCYPDTYSCWYELGYTNQVYRWNGTEFVFWLATDSAIE